jgi:hypothetical protein
VRRALPALGEVGHDQVGAVLERRDAVERIAEDRVVDGLGGVDRADDAQHLAAGDVGDELVVEAGAGLLDPGEVERGDAGDARQRLVADAVGGRDRGLALDGRDLLEAGAEVRVPGALVAPKEAGLDGEVGQVGEPADRPEAGDRGLAITRNRSRLTGWAPIACR